MATTKSASTGLAFALLFCRPTIRFPSMPDLVASAVPILTRRAAGISQAARQNPVVASPGGTAQGEDGRVHSVELVLDDDTDQQIRAQWNPLGSVGAASQA